MFYCPVVLSQLQLELAVSTEKENGKHQLCLLNGEKSGLEKAFGFKSKLPLELLGAISKAE